jgi:hypothetical protein
VKSLQLEQKPIDLVEQGKSAKDPPMEHVYQDGKKKEDAHSADGGKGYDKLKSRRPKFSFKELLAKYEKIAEANIGQRKSHHQNCLQRASLKSGIGKEIDLMQQQHILLLSSQFSCQMDHSPYIFILIYLGAGLIKRHVFHHISDHKYIEYVVPRYLEKSSSYKDRFDQNWSGAQAKKKVVKQV